ncbi:MAG: hypothetical protein ABSH44_10760 [Bryobacteraceae bacterium]|jgi:hypothetical protein
MNALVLPLTALGGVVLVGMWLSFLTLARARAVLRDAEQRGNAGLKQWEAALRAMGQDLDGLGAQLGDIRQQPPLAMAPALPRPGLNLSTRSQALRMHRRGNPPERIAAALQVPLQEVDLLLKVQRIIAGNL